MAWQLKYSGKNQQWKKVADESLYVPFFVEDATGDALVDPQGAELDIHRNFHDELGDSFFSTSGMMPKNVSAFLLRYGLLGTEKIRLEEYCIKPSDPLFILGTLCQNTAATRWTPSVHIAALGSSFKSRLSLFGPTGSSIFRALGWAPGLTVPLEKTQPQQPAPASAHWSSVSLEDEAMHAMAAHSHRQASAVASPAAAETAPSVATAETAPPESDPAPDNTAAGFNMHPPAAIAKGANHDLFMISWRSQREVVQSLAWKSALCIWGGPTLTLACVYFLILSLGWA